LVYIGDDTRKNPQLKKEDMKHNIKELQVSDVNLASDFFIFQKNELQQPNVF